MKRNLKKYLSLGLAAVMAASLITGCGVATANGDTSATAATSAAAQTAASRDATAATASGDTVKIGVYEPASGDNGAGGKQEMLGMQYANGDAVDLVAAHKWFNLAALRGYEDAAWHRQQLAEEMSAAEIATAQRAAREWLRTH